MPTSAHFQDVQLVMVPGLGLNREAWNPTITALSSTGRLAPEHLEVVLLPAYGVPADRGEQLSPAVVARRLVDRLPEGVRHVLMGHSASCQVVVQAALQAPASVAGLVLVGPTTDPRAVTWPRLAARWLATAGHERPSQVPALVRQYRRTGLRSMAGGMDAARRDRIHAALPQATCPVLLLRGRHDRIAPEDWLVSLADGRRSTRRVTLPEGAHMVPLTHGPQVAAAILDFLSDFDG